MARCSQKNAKRSVKACHLFSAPSNNTANVLEKMANSVQAAAKARLHEIWMAPAREAAHKAFDHFVAAYQANYPAATEWRETPAGRDSHREIHKR